MKRLKTANQAIRLLKETATPYQFEGFVTCLIALLILFGAQCLQIDDPFVLWVGRILLMCGALHVAKGFFRLFRQIGVIAIALPVLTQQ